MQTKVIGYVRTYMDLYFEGRKIFEPYLEATGSTQSWNLFAGTPPKYPQVMQVEVFAPGSNGWQLFQDFSWGTPEFEATPFRHYEVHLNLIAPGWDRHRQWYANYWARRWNQQNPTRRAQYVRLSYLRLTTPSAEQVRAGNSDRKPTRVQEFVWPVPADLKP
jgi:hypothetical protein